MVWAGLVLAIRNHRGIIDTLLHLTRVSMEPMGRNEPSSSVLVFFPPPLTKYDRFLGTCRVGVYSFKASAVRLLQGSSPSGC